MRFDRALDPQLGITVVRLMMGVILVVAGLTKWLAGIGGTIAFFGQLGIPAPQIVGPVIAAGEVIGGVLLVVGFGARMVAVWFVGEFLVTAIYVKLARGAGWDAARIDLMMLAGSAMLFLAGAGKLALDAWMAARSGQVATQSGRAQLISSR